MKALAVAACAAFPIAAAAAAYDVDARTEGQFYAVPRYLADGRSRQWLSVNRVVQVLDAAGFELVTGEDFGFEILLRLDADFGVSRAEAEGLDGAARSRVQMLVGRAHWNGILGGLLDLEAGRITALDAASFYAFDGGRLTVRPLRWLALAAFGGLRETGESWLGSPAWAPDGVRASDARRLAAEPAAPCPAPGLPCPDPTLAGAAPVLGGRLSVTALPGGLGGAELEYRRTRRGGGVIEERLGASARYRAGPLAVAGALDHDLYLGRVAAARLSARVQALPWLAVAAEAGRRHESFSADSIFNLYDTAPWQEARLRIELGRAGGELRAWAAGGLAWVRPTDFGRATFGDEGGTAPEASAGGEIRAGGTTLRAEGSWRGGVEGRAARASAWARQPLAGWLALDGRLDLVSLRDPVRPANDGEFLALALGLRGRLERRAQLAVVLEDAATRFDRHDLRVYGLLSLGADWDAGVR